MNFKKNETNQKLRGGYYTDLRIARYLLDWACEPAVRSLLEPSCGDGSFFAALKQSGRRPPLQITGIELDGCEAAKARRLLGQVTPRPNVHVGDFLEWALLRLGTPPEFDAVVGNPPFIRYQYLDRHLQARAERLIQACGLRFTRHTNAWVPFLIASLTRLRPGGRLAMVLPSEILHVLHARSARDYLLRTCSRVLIIDPTEIWFEQTLQGVVLLLAERKAESDGEAPGEVGVSRVTGNGFLRAHAREIFARTVFVSGDDLPGKWTFALLSRTERKLLARADRTHGIARFSDVASVEVGIVTGANKFFLVPDKVVDTFDLDDFAFPMFGRSDHVPGIVYDHQVHGSNRRQGLPTNFLWFRPEHDHLPPSALQYIRLGESEGLHLRYKCRIRNPWYAVPSVFSSPVGMLKRSHDFPRLVLNTIGAFTTDTAYRVIPTNIPARHLVFGFVNSLTALSCELEGRSYGGGVLELVPSEIDKLLIPRPTTLNGRLRSLDAILRQQVPPDEVLEAQDLELLAPLGFSRTECDTFRNAWLRLRNRRQRTV